MIILDLEMICHFKQQKSDSEWLNCSASQLIVVEVKTPYCAFKEEIKCVIIACRALVSFGTFFCRASES